MLSSLGGDEALVHVEQGLALLGGQLLVGGDGFADADARLVGGRQEAGPLVQRLGADLQRLGDLLQDVGRRLAQAALDLRQVRVADAGQVGQAAHAHAGDLALRLDQLADIGQSLVEVVAHRGHESASFSRRRRAGRRRWPRRRGSDAPARR